MRSVYLSQIGARKQSRTKRGGGGVRTPRKNHKNIWFLSSPGADPLKITKLHSQHSMLGHHQRQKKNGVCWQADDGPLIVVFFFDPVASKKRCQS